jgi:hypothetical protein
MSVVQSHLTSGGERTCVVKPERTPRNTAEAIEDALLCAREGAERDIANRLFLTGARFGRLRYAKLLPPAGGIEHIPRPAGLQGQWTVEWSAGGITQGIVFRSFSREAEALYAVYALVEMDSLEIPGAHAPPFAPGA